VFFAYDLNAVLLYYQANNGDRLPWKSAFSFVDEHAQEQDVVVAFWPEFHPYYVAQPINAYEDVNLKSMLASHKRYWFVLDSETIWTNGEVKTWLESNAQLMDVWYLRRPENNFLRVYLFDPLRPVNP
jgi:hypothetical protein